jgi:hypothetical protein
MDENDLIRYQKLHDLIEAQNKTLKDIQRSASRVATIVVIWFILQIIAAIANFLL